MGWPPIRSFRRQTLATTSKNTEDVEGKSGPGALFVKVSLDGAPYLRKVDLKNYSAYQELSSALEKMFSCFTIGEILQRFNCYTNALVNLFKVMQFMLNSEFNFQSCCICMDPVTALLV